ncbi:integrase family protein [Brenneria sp. KBI 447]|uniref:Integrase family protein n=1 Tax=Brenneria izbisi TaxID=2939450 RepID=A0AA42C5X5_9GAMM|nr:integrase family protein [Brenneria izbisi]MCV9883025.1 integrase family protein [Brenneria izbisi]
MKYRTHGKEKKLAFSPCPDISLFKTRQLRDAARTKVREGANPEADKKITQQKLWIIPETREPIENVRFSHRGTKMKTQHIVPLSKQAIAI